MRTLTPALLLPAPGQVSLIHERVLRNIPSPTTPCAPFPAMPLAPVGLGLRFAWVSLSPVLRTSYITRSLVSRIRPNRVCVAGFSGPVCSTDYSFISSCSPHHVTMTQLLPITGGGATREGLPPSCSRSLSSARARPSRSLRLASRQSLPCIGNTKSNRNTAVNQRFWKDFMALVGAESPGETPGEACETHALPETGNAGVRPSRGARPSRSLRLASRQSLRTALFRQP